jgi:hypothetical protein
VEKLSVEWLRRGRALSLHSPHLAVLLRQIITRAGPPPAMTSVRPCGPQLCLDARCSEQCLIDPPTVVLMHMCRFQPEKFSFWIGNILPTSTAEKLQMLDVTSTAQRLAHLKTLLKVCIAFASCATDFAAALPRARCSSKQRVPAYLPTCLPTYLPTHLPT